MGKRAWNMALSDDGKNLVAGTKDQYCPEDALRRLGDRLAAEVDIIEGAEHFFFAKLFPLGQTVERWLRRWAV